MGFIIAQGAGFNGVGNDNAPPFGASNISIPNMRAGDIFLVSMCDTHATTDPLSYTGLTNAATAIENNIDATSFFGVTSTIYSAYTIIAAADLASHTVTFRNVSDSNNVGWVFTLIRPTVLSGGSCTVQTIAASTAVLGTSWTLPRNTNLQAHDVRLYLIYYTTSATDFSVAESQTVTNPGKAGQYFAVLNGGTSSNACSMIINPGLPSLTDSATSTLTMSGGVATKMRFVPVIISEGASDADPAIGVSLDDPYNCPITILASGIDHDVGSPAAEIIGRGGGSGISVY